MPVSEPSRPNILVAIDYSDGSTSVVEHALAISQGYRPCTLHFLHVNQSRVKDDEGQEAQRFELMEWLAARLPQADEALADVTVIAHEATGDPWHVIVQMASDLMSDMVVLGTGGRKGLERMMMGSVAEAVSRHCGCSVSVLRKKAHDQPFMELEPRCGLCVEARLESKGAVLWCHDHVARQARRHAHYGKSISQWARQSFEAST
jgi:nucleotide-binding universal stress UspA family protein